MKTLFATTLYSLLPIFLLSLPSSIMAAQQETVIPDYTLSLSFDLEKHEVSGTAKIILAPDEPHTLYLEGIKITGSLLKDDQGHEQTLVFRGKTVPIPATSRKRTLYISYTKTVSNSRENRIGPDGITLLRNWHPTLGRPVLFSLNASLPPGFTSICESDSFPLVMNKKTVRTSFSHPLSSLHFTAGPYVHKQYEVKKGFFIHTLFFPEDRQLADSYLKKGAAYLKRYEKEIGPFPYNQYVIVANRFPSGFGFPGFTLIGQAVLRLPFIKNTSLGHEILHSWFGNSVEVNYMEGNWCEGLTAYLSDHAFREENGEGTQDRKEMITNYLSYVNNKNAISLDRFISANHGESSEKALRAVGYGRAAMLFHELREKTGDDIFFHAIQIFYKKNRWRKASWSDLQDAFETISGIRLETFFRERLKRPEIPSLSVKNSRIIYKNGAPTLVFSLVQHSEKPFSLLVPVHVRGTAGTDVSSFFISQKENRIEIPLNYRPLEFTIDPEYSFMRELVPEEKYSTWSRFLGSEKKLVILGSERERSIYAPLLSFAAFRDSKVKLSSEVTNRELAKNDLLFLGTDQKAARSLFGSPGHFTDDFTLDARFNPLDQHFAAMLLSSPSRETTEKVAGRLNHYGKYSFLRFHRGKIVEKHINYGQMGIKTVMESLPEGGETTALTPFERIIEQLDSVRVIYIGETHTANSDHLLQLRVIEALFARDPNLAIGMEMFPADNQQPLDDYIVNRVHDDERTFLKQSEYFKVWRYDYRFFRDIIEFARKNKLPVLGLNLKRDIVTKVFRSGNTDGLDQKVMEKLPENRDLDMEGYYTRLNRVHTLHDQTGSRGSISGFIQAQGLWDETMAENISNWLHKNPGKKLVVLAGTQHTRKDSGIPPRVKRRINVSQASLLNIYSSAPSSNLRTIADYFFLSTAPELPENPRIGIILETVKEEGQSFMKITGISPHGNAGKAGLQANDVILEINHFPVSEMSDVRIAMINTENGDTIPVKISRDVNGKKQELLFKVELTLPAETMANHP
ncbi:ChaN family lipoprotein [Desulfomarina sp.]